MKLRIGHKLFLAMLVATGFAVAVMILVQRHTFERGFLDYVQNIELDRLHGIGEIMIQRYHLRGNWAFIAGQKQLPVGLHRQRSRFAGGPPGRRSMGAGRPEGLDLAYPVAMGDVPMRDRLGLLDAQGLWVAGVESPEQLARHELRSEGIVIGYLTLAPLKTLDDELDLQFSRQQLRGVSLAALVAFIGAALAAAIFARNLGAPIRALTRGTQTLIGGDYNVRLPTGRDDELGWLAKDFNSLSQELESGRQARRQWLVDISHELRTPIAILQAELEAIEDGLSPLDPAALQSFGVEIKRLRSLVNDLHQLAQSDSGTLTLEREMLDLATLLEQTVERFRGPFSARRLSLELDVQETPRIFADPDRLRQLFVNLLENARRYTDPNGTVRIRMELRGVFVRISIEDSAPGVPEEALSRIFDRLYRVDPSRSRETGASGLGLAISQGIVEAHKGQIGARHSTMGGLVIDVDLPIDSEGV